MPRRVHVGLVAAATTLLLAAPVTAPAQAAERRTPPVTVTGTNVAFSPNGDGLKDLGTVSYRLAKPGRVTATVTSRGKRVLREQLGRQGRGTRTFTWDGRRAGGRTVADGTYVVTIASGTGRARTEIEVDARYSSAPVGDLRLSSDTVYPQATVIRDVVVGAFVPASTFTGSIGTVRRQVLDRRGDVVDSAPLALFATGSPEDTCGSGCGRLTWDGRDRNGDLLPAGAYRVRLVRGTTSAGNPVVLTGQRTITVSAKQLVARTTTTSTSAVGTTTLPIDDAGSNGGAATRCEPTPSDARFPGGLSFRSVTNASGTPCVAIRQFSGEAPARRTPYDSYRVTATGAPTTAGSTDTGTLRVGGTTATMTPTSTSVGLSSLTAPNTEAVVEASEPAISWSFSTSDGRSYDLGTFEYTLTQYVEAR